MFSLFSCKSNSNRSWYCWHKTRTQIRFTDEYKSTLSALLEDIQFNRKQPIQAEKQCTALLLSLQKFFPDHRITNENFKEIDPFLKNCIDLTLVHRINASYQQEKFSQAIQDASLLLELNPMHEHALWMRGLCLAQNKKNYHLAMEDYQRILNGNKIYKFIVKKPDESPDLDTTHVYFYWRKNCYYRNAFGENHKLQLSDDPDSQRLFKRIMQDDNEIELSTQDVYDLFERNETLLTYDYTSMARDHNRKLIHSRKQSHWPSWATHTNLQKTHPIPIPVSIGPRIVESTVGKNYLI